VDLMGKCCQQRGQPFRWLFHLYAMDILAGNQPEQIRSGRRIDHFWANGGRRPH
jgi:hypothetical protein